VSYVAALEWLSAHLDDDIIPLRLHDRSIGEDGAPRLSASFLAWLTSEAFDASPVIVTRSCYHPQLDRGSDPWTCPTCVGSGVFDATEWHFRRPMRAALESLARNPNPWPERQPAPAAILRALLMYALDGRAAAVHLGLSWDAYEALVVMATRRLRSRYGVIVPARIPTLQTA
jgi:hypothetical protein